MSNTVTTIRVIHAGLYTVLQDSGRSGHQAFGVPVGGALDRAAANTANQLVGQAEDNPVLEITLSGPELQFNGPLQIALSGADLSPVVNGRQVPMYTTLQLAAGDILGFGKRQNGCRTYLAVAGQWQVPEWLGSRSALQAGRQIWPAGSLLHKEDQLRVLPTEPVAVRSVVSSEHPFYSRHLTVRVLPGPEFSWLEEQTVAYFTTHAFTLSSAANRMGYRLEQMLPAYRHTQELISSGIVPGTIQLLPSARLVILLADAQTTGGYPRIANVQHRDLDHLAQLAPGDSVRFAW